MPSNSFWFGSDPSMEKLPTLSPEQQQIYSHLQGQINPNGGLNNPMFQQGQSYLQNQFNQSPEARKEFEAPYLRQFQEQTLPSIAARFGGGEYNSGDFNRAATGAGRELSENLASLRGQQQQSLFPHLLQYSQAGNQLGMGLLGIPQFAYHQREGQKGFAQSAAPGVFDALSKIALGFAGGGPAGAAAGGVSAILPLLMKLLGGDSGQDKYDNSIYTG